MVMTRVAGSAGMSRLVLGESYSKYVRADMWLVPVVHLGSSVINAVRPVVAVVVFVACLLWLATVLTDASNG